MYGEDGDDTFYGGNGLNYMYGGDGDDNFTGGELADYIEGCNPACKNKKMLKTINFLSVSSTSFVELLFKEQNQEKHYCGTT